MKKLILFLIIIFEFTAVFSQHNLVPNYSFEELKKCPDDEEKVNKVLYNWYSPTVQLHVIFNSCANIDYFYFGVPKNAGGFQFAFEGNGYASFAVFRNSNQREYYSVKLIDSLIKGSIYDVKFYISCIDDGINAADEIGLYLSKDSIYENTPYHLGYTPQIKSPKGEPITDTANWVEVSGRYTAKGGEQFITIGQFKSDSQTTWKTINPNGWSKCFYYLDNVSVILFRDSVPPPPPTPNPTYSLYPNPTKDNVIISFDDILPEKVELELYDMLGRKILIELPQSNSQIFEVNLGSLAAGVYVYKLKVNGGYFGDGKLVIVR